MTIPSIRCALPCHDAASLAVTRFGKVDKQDPLHLQIASSVRAAIVRGDLLVEERLPLERLAAEFGVSRMPVREALIRLERERLVEFHPRRGAIVAGIEPGGIGELFELRVLLETDMLRRAPERLAARHLAEARTLLERASAANGFDEQCDLYRASQDALYAPIGRRTQLDFLGMVWTRIDWMIRRVFRLIGSRTGRLEESVELVGLIETRELAPALALVERHAERDRRHLLSAPDILRELQSSSRED